MKKDYTFQKFETDYFDLLNSYTNKNTIDETLITKLKYVFTNFKDKTTSNYQKHLDIIDKLDIRKNKELENFNNFLTDLNNKYLVRKENIKKTNKENILKINEEIFKLQASSKKDIESLVEAKTKKIKQLEANTKIIDEAAKLNLSRINTNNQVAKDNYANYIEERVKDLNTTSNKIHSYYSKQIMLLNEVDTDEILATQTDIEKLEEDIASLTEKYNEERNELNRQKLVIVTSLNNDIRIYTKEKTTTFKKETEDNIIKQKDILKQLSFYEDEYNSKVQKILADFINELSQYDESSEHAKKEYDENIERTKRNYFYNYYALNNELNEYLKEVKKENNEGLRLKLVTRRLNKLKKNTYYQKIKELKENYHNELKKLNTTYNETIRLNKFNQNVAEINKNYELDIAKIEFNTAKDNNKLLGEYIHKQIETNISNNENEYEYVVSNAKAKANFEIAKFDRDLKLLQARHQYETNELRIKILNLRAKINRLSNTLKLREDYYNTSSSLGLQLEQIISSLELDRNAKIKEYNDKNYSLSSKTIEIYAKFQKEKIKNQTDYLTRQIKLHRKQASILFSKERLPYVRDIDIISAKEKYNVSYEESYYDKNVGLLELNHNRRNYRFDSLVLAQNGTFIFNLLEDLVKLFSLIKEILVEVLRKNEHDIVLMYQNLANLIFNYYKVILNNFNSSEAIIIEEFIQNETKNTYKNKKNTLQINFSSATTKLYNKIKEYDEIKAKYDNTIRVNEDILKDCDRRLIELRSTSSLIGYYFSRTRKDILNEKKEATELINKTINLKKNIDLLINNTNLEIANVENKYNLDLTKNDNLLKQEYNSSYTLIYKANSYVKKIYNKVDKLRDTYITKFNLNSLANILFIKLINLTKKARRTYLSLFDTFKVDNENKYLKKRKTLIKVYQGKIKNNYLSSLRHIRHINRNYKNTSNKISNLIEETNSELIKLDYSFKNKANFIIDTKNQAIKSNNKTKKIIKATYNKILYAISDNLTYARLNYYKSSQENHLNYKSDLLNITNNYKKELKNNLDNLNNYKHRLHLDEKNIPLAYNRTIKENKEDIKNSKNKSLKVKSLNNLNKKKNKKEYQRLRVINISKSTRQLLFEKINVNNTLKRLKNYKERND